MIPIYTGGRIDEYLLGLQVRSGDSSIAKTVGEIIDDVRENGDAAVRKYAKHFDDFDGPDYLLSQDEVAALVASLPYELKVSLQFAAENIRKFGWEIVDSSHEPEMKMDGYRIGMRFRPVKSAACYVPGGRYPLPSTALMTAVTARVAGVEDISIFSPALPPSVVYAGVLAGVKKFYRLGGVQAVAACAFGTETIPAMDMLVGPGNAYVTEAKRQLQGVIGIDMLAGPSEVAIIADGGANPEYVAADLLAQAEHDPLARAWLISDDKDFADAVLKHLGRISEKLELPDFLAESLGNGAVFLCDSLKQCIEVSNRLAPEHVQLVVKDSETIKDSLVHFGSLFIGIKTSVAYGDYAAGVNHTLPTGGGARFSSGLSPLTFLRTQTWTEVTGDPTALRDYTMSLAREEGLLAHEYSVKVRS